MNIHEKEEKFRELVFQFHPEYDSKMLNEFYFYWTEPNKSGTKLRWELEKTWDLSRRLRRWSNNQNLWHGQQFNKTGNGTSKLGTSAARIEALRNW